MKIQHKSLINEKLQRKLNVKNSGHSLFIPDNGLNCYLLELMAGLDTRSIWCIYSFHFFPNNSLIISTNRLLDDATIRFV